MDHFLAERCGDCGCGSCVSWKLLMSLINGGENIDIVIVVISKAAKEMGTVFES